MLIVYAIVYVLIYSCCATSQELNQSWWSVASDSTGQYLVATVNGGSIYTSNDYGEMFFSTSAPINDWRSVASDSSGQYLVAVAPGWAAA